MSGAGSPQALIDVLTFERDVAEVSLLIDHVSGRSEKSLKDIDTKNVVLPPPDGGSPAATLPGEPTVSEILHRFAQVHYPPEPDPMTKAQKSTFVLTLKDRLSALAAPARGITIAYTTMFITASDGCASKHWFRRRPPPDAAASTRGSLATMAYPGLESHARCFAHTYRTFPFLMFLTLVLTASAYWDIGFGRTIVQQIEQLDKQQEDLLHPDTRTAPGVVAVSSRICLADNGPPPDQEQACGPLLHLHHQLIDAREDLFEFAATTTCASSKERPLPPWIVCAISWLRPISWSFMLEGQEPSLDRPEATVAWILSLFSTYVLPAMFGFLGTLAGIMRAIQSKLRDNLLGPRDLPMSLLGLVLGPVAGLSVGLFFTPGGASTVGSAGLAGSVSLSASGLGFLAGYGADAFFKFVDALLIRVFAMDQSSK